MEGTPIFRLGTRRLGNNSADFANQCVSDALELRIDALMELFPFGTTAMPAEGHC
jgi:hypothetical protein